MAKDKSTRVERRFFSRGSIELRADGEDEGQRIVHHAPPWDTLSVPLWYERRGEKWKPVREQFQRGSFSDLLGSGADVMALRDHDVSRVLGRLGAETLRLEEDDVGLRYEIEPPDTSEGRDTVELVRRRDIPGSSFSFYVGEDGEEAWAETDEAIVRTVVRASYLGDVGPVTFPAYPDGPQGSPSLRSAGHAGEAVAAFDQWMKSQGAEDEDLAEVRSRRRRQALADLGIRLDIA